MSSEKFCSAATQSVTEGVAQQNGFSVGARNDIDWCAHQSSMLAMYARAVSGSAEDLVPWSHSSRGVSRKRAAGSLRRPHRSGSQRSRPRRWWPTQIEISSSPSSTSSLVRHRPDTELILTAVRRATAQTTRIVSGARSWHQTRGPAQPGATRSRRIIPWGTGPSPLEWCMPW